MTTTNCRFIFIVICAVTAIVLFWQTFSLPAPKFEPVGGARVPQVIALLIMFLCIAAGFISLRNPVEADESAQRATPGRGVVFVTMFIAYAIGLWLGIAGFAWLTAAFQVALQWAYGIPGKHRLITYGVLILSAFALEYIFTHIFVIDLAMSF